MSEGSNGRCYRFHEFQLDVAGRRLMRGSEQVSLSARYFDSLALMVSQPGVLIEKQRFFDEVWEGVIVTDGALTQAIKAIRQQLGDSASSPRFIETVPGYGYRFISPVETVQAVEAPVGESRLLDGSKRSLIGQGLAGTVGGAAAGLLGGLIYGYAVILTGQDPRLGASSVLVALVSLCVLVGTIAGLGVSGGVTAARILFGRRPIWTVLGAAGGGLVIGTTVKLLGMDAFSLLFGAAPAGVTGGLEGATIGLALGLGTVAMGGFTGSPRWKPVLGAGVACGVAGILIAWLGGRLMAGSLQLLTASFAGSRLQIELLGRFFGEASFGPRTQVILGGLEGFIFGCCVVAAFVLAATRKKT